RKANPGAYIGTLLDDAIVKARDAEREREAQDFEASQQRVGDVDVSIGTMPGAKLKEIIESIGWLKGKGLSPDGLRADPVLRAELARHLSKREVGVA
ncbi:MAG: hypothetical protein IH835_01320, partial [Proteobacteria bacterium]|nr:hypothetical protein [Pseudomonadota bacterium]